MSNADHNLFIDEGAQKSTGGIERASRLCDILGVKNEGEPPDENYQQGWGQEYLHPKVIK